MRQLFTDTNGTKECWSCGSTRCFPKQDYQNGRFILPVAIQCQIGNLEVFETALLDTASTWSVIGGECFELLQNELTDPMESLDMHTRDGRIHGQLHKLKIKLIAEEGSGVDLSIDGTVFISKQWMGPVVLGYGGFLEHIRFAVDPGRKPFEESFFFFGS